jgi:hypothetical protein
MVIFAGILDESLIRLKLRTTHHDRDGVSLLHYQFKPVSSQSYSVWA